MRTHTYYIVLLCLVLLLLAVTSMGQHQHAAHETPAVNYPISCTPQAQKQFNQALTLLHHMTYPQAREEFQRVAVMDPKCAMAQWGIAMTLFQPLWPTRPAPELRRQGWQAIEKGKSLPPPTEREQLFLAATEAFFLD